ncbi:MAG: hypothetical protein NVS1B11_36300 [Terriglobales bacterium]
MRIYCVGPVGPRFTTVTAVTTGAPIVITTAAPHGFSNQDVVTIGGVLGTVNANGTYDPGAFSVTATTITLSNKNGGGAVYTGGGIASAPQQLITAPNFPVLSGFPDNTKLMAMRMLFVPAPTGTATLYLGTVGLNQATLRNVFRPINPPPTAGIYDDYEIETGQDNQIPIGEYWIDAGKPSTEAIISTFWIR